MSAPTTESEQRGTAWVSQPAVDLAELDDKRLTSYRHPDEARALAMLTVGAVALLVGLWFVYPTIGELLRWLPSPIAQLVNAVLHPTRLGPFLLVVLLTVIAIDAVGLLLRKYDLPYGAVEINAVTFPQFGPVVEELSRRFDIPKTRVFATRAAPLGGSALGMWEPYLIVFSTGLLGSLTVEEFRFLLGRQMGHIKLGHTRTAVIFGGSMPLSLAWLRQLRLFVFGNYQRAQELSADRIGLLATRDLRPVLTFVTKFEIGTVRGAKIDLESLEPRAVELQGGREATIARLRQLLASQPRFIFRLLEMTRWAGLPPPPAPSQPEAGASAAAAAPGGAPAAGASAAGVTAAATAVPSAPTSAAGTNPSASAAPAAEATAAAAPAATSAATSAAPSSAAVGGSAPAATAASSQQPTTDGPKARPGEVASAPASTGAPTAAAKAPTAESAPTGPAANGAPSAESAPTGPASEAASSEAVTIARRPVSPNPGAAESAPPTTTPPTASA